MFLLDFYQIFHSLPIKVETEIWLPLSSLTEAPDRMADEKGTTP